MGKRFDKAEKIANELLKESTLDALTIMTMAASLVLRALPPDKFEEAVDLHTKLLRLRPSCLPERFQNAKEKFIGKFKQ